MQIFAGSSFVRRMRSMYFIIVFKFTRVRVDRDKRYENGIVDAVVFELVKFFACENIYTPGTCVDGTLQYVACRLLQTSQIML